MIHTFGIPTLDRMEYGRVRAAVSDPQNLPPNFDTWASLMGSIRDTHERMGATTVEVAASHVAMVSHPAEVAELVEKAAEAVGAAAR